MSLSADFNGQYNAYRENDYVLRVNFGSIYYYYDFMTRLLVTKNTSGTTGITTTPFSQLDRESLALMREELIRQGGKPPELPADGTGPSAPPRKLNL
jgi:hypothetical protein